MDASPERVNIRDVWIRRVLLREVPEHVAREQTVLPIDMIDGVLKVVIPESDDVRDKREMLRFVLNRRIATAIAAADEIRIAIDRHYGRSQFE